MGIIDPYETSNDIVLMFTNYLFDDDLVYLEEYFSAILRDNIVMVLIQYFFSKTESSGKIYLNKLIFEQPPLDPFYLKTFGFFDSFRQHKKILIRFERHAVTYIR